MGNAARKINPSFVSEESGTVKLVDGDTATVELGSGVVSAKRAVSCLVAPIEGDRVVVAVEASGKTYVLAVLERMHEQAKTTLSVQGDLEIRTPSGTCSIAAQEGVHITSPEEVKITSNTLSVSALTGTVVMEKASVVAKWMLAELSKVKLVAETMDSVVGRISQRVDRSYRTVKEIDQVKAQHIDYSAEAQIRMHAKNTIVTSDNLVKIDGEQIHFG